MGTGDCVGRELLAAGLNCNFHKHAKKIPGAGIQHGCETHGNTNSPSTTLECKPTSTPPKREPDSEACGPHWKPHSEDFDLRMNSWLHTQSQFQAPTLRVSEYSNNRENINHSHHKKRGQNGTKDQNSTKSLNAKRRRDNTS